MSLKKALPFYISTSNDLEFLLFHIPHTWQHLVFVLVLDHSNRCVVSMVIFFCVECLSFNIVFWYSSRLLDLCSCNLILFSALYDYITLQLLILLFSYLTTVVLFYFFYITTNELMSILIYVSWFTSAYIVYGYVLDIHIFNFRGLTLL